MSMTKVIRPSDWDFGEPEVQLVKVSSQGLKGQDRRDFTKRASSVFAQNIPEIMEKLGSGEELVHIFALGTTEFFNANRNGDGFKREICRKYHPTFTKRARLYRDHINKDRRKSYGRVVASCLHPEMHRVELLTALFGTKEAADRHDALLADLELEKLARNEVPPTSMACFTNPEYPIATRDRGYVGIADVRVGDYVWTHKGRWRRVTKLIHRSYTGQVYWFRVAGMPKLLAAELTAEHPMLAKIFSHTAVSEDALKRHAERFFKDVATFNAAEVEWVAAEHIGRGDRFFHKPVTRYTGYGAIDDEPLAAIMGYYLAEGSFGYNGDVPSLVEFTCNIADSAVRRIPQIMAAMYPDVTVDIRPRANSEQSIALIVHNTSFATFMLKQLGAGVRQKLIPPEIFNAREAVRLSFIGAWLDGDGWLDAKGAHWSTCNAHLALQGRDLLAALGIPASIYAIDHAKCATSGYENSGVEYTLNVSHYEAWRFAAYSEKAAQYTPPEVTRQKPATMRLCPNGTYAYRVKEVIARHVVNCPVYNFEVEEDESYSAAGLMSHNCQVSHDICSGCGNKAKHRGEYCDEKQCTKYGGLKKNMGHLYADGHVLHADNPDPSFFDISHIHQHGHGRGADRIAFILGKVAADGTDNCVGGAALAESWGVSAPIFLDIPTGLLSKAAIAQLSIAQRLISIEDRMYGDMHKTANLACVGHTLEQHMPACQGSMNKLASVLRATHDAQCLLPVGSFLELLCGREKVAAVLNDVVAALPGIHDKLAASVNFAMRLQQNPYLADTASTPADRRWAVALQPTCSLALRMAEKRAAVATLYGQQPGSIVKQASSSQAASQLAEEYALYQLAFLRTHSSSPDLPLMAELCVRNNFVR